MITIFAKEAFLNINPNEPLRLRTKPIKGGHVQRVSSIIRADQIAEKIGAKLNPISGYDKSICIYIKPMVRKGDDFKFEGKRAYLDIIDGHNLGELLLKHPDVGVIVCSRADYETMYLVVPNKIVLIPQHHLNFERIKRDRKGITTVGVIGTEKSFVHLPEELEKGLKERGIELFKFSKFYKREDVIDFYKKIDLQIVWRPYRMILHNPLKIVNASSFGIPTIALDEKAFKEVEGCYIGVKTSEEFFIELDKLIDNPDLYEAISDYCLIKAEEYHIDNIAKLYKKL